MQINRFKPDPNADHSLSIWTRMGQFFRRPAGRRREPVLIKVWDSQREQYRHVDLLNREDPLWFAARDLATIQATFSSKSAA